MTVKIENNSVNLCDSCEKDCETCDAYDKDYLPGDCDTNICCCSRYAPLMTREQLNDGPDNNETTDLISRRQALYALNEIISMEHSLRPKIYVAKTRIRNLPPGIVQCKDCKYYNQEEKECLDLMGHGRRWEDDDYCRYGERGEVTT